MDRWNPTSDLPHNPDLTMLKSSWHPGRTASPMGGGQGLTDDDDGYRSAIAVPQNCQNWTAFSAWRWTYRRSCGGC